MRKLLSWSIGSLALALLLTGCGDPGAAGPPAATPVATPVAPSIAVVAYRPSAAHVPACAHVGHAVPLPAGFPATFPLPRGTAITSWQYYNGDHTRVIVEGIVPSADFATTVKFFIYALPGTGFVMRAGEAEPPNDAESVYVGHGYIGRWRTQSIFGCDNALLFTAFAEPFPIHAAAPLPRHA